MKRTSTLPVSQYEHKLELIQEEYLQKHFQQITTILSKYYHYSFQIIKYLWRVEPSRKSIAANNLLKVVSEVVRKRKMVVVASLVRRIDHLRYSKSKACIFIATFLQRKVIGAFIGFFNQIKDNSSIQPAIPKDQQLFLIIMLSNLNKLLTYAKSEAFSLIKTEQLVRNQEISKIKLMKMMLILNKYVNRLLIDSLLSITHPNALRKGLPQRSDDEESGDDESILIESYKMMASNLSVVYSSKAKHQPLQQMKMQAGVTQLFKTLKQKRQNLIRWCFVDLCCFQNHRFKASTLQVLQRQIAILEQEYQSI